MEQQYIVINTLDSLGLLLENPYDEYNVTWYHYTLSPIVLFCFLMQNGEITTIRPVEES